jgi:hypothetical protein
MNRKMTAVESLRLALPGAGGTFVFWQRRAATGRGGHRQATNFAILRPPKN